MREDTAPIRLYVEGDTDYDFFVQLLLQENLIEQIWVKKYGGTSHNLKRNHLLPLKDTSAYVTGMLKVVGVVTDADQNPARAFQSVQGALRESDYPYPNNPLEISPPDSKGLQTAIIVLPDRHTNGYIEDLFLKAFANYDAMQCLELYEEAFMNCLSDKDIALRQSRISKAKYQMFLAAVGGELSVRDAFKKRDWFPWDSSEFTEARNFLNMLANSAKTI